MVQAHTNAQATLISNQKFEVRPTLPRKRLAIVTTHPIQYQSPWFRALANHPQLDTEVLFCHRATPKEQAAAGFNVEFEWDISLLDGYTHRFVKNVAENPSVLTFGGLNNPELPRIIERERFDAVLVNGWHYRSAWQAIRACWRTGTPVMVRSDSHLRTKRSAAKLALKWPLYRWFISRFDACLPVGEWSKDYFLHYGARPERIFTVPHVVDTDYLAKESQQLATRRGELRASWQLASDQVVYLFAGKFVEKKRPIDFVRAIAKAATKGASVAGLMVGDGPLKAECEQVAVEQHAPIRFAGFLNQSEMPMAYVAADALVLPSDGGETWGLVVNEAMGSGRPCFVSDKVGCGPDLIQPGITGDIFSLGDIEGLANLLSSFSSKQLETMGIAARASAKSKSIEAAVDGVLQAMSIVKAGNK
jgi:glycosyltransferase involved in cell wall biosynthesis